MDLGYTVMPFGPTNGPATFINFIHDLASIWKDLASQSGIPIARYPLPLLAEKLSKQAMRTSKH